MGGYTLTRLGSLGTVLFIGILVVLFTSNTLQTWHHLLVWTYILGYTHFILGYYYQSKAVIRKGFRSRSMVAFIALTLFAIISVILVANSPFYLFLVVFTIPYFMLHGLFNEYTLTKLQTGFLIPTSLLVSGIVWITALLLFSMTHNSFFWGDGLVFFDVQDGYFVSKLTQTFPLWVFRELPYLLFSITIPIFGVSLALLPSKQRIIGIVVGLILLATTLLTILIGPLAFVYLFAFTNSYHFVMWMLHYGKIFWQRSKKQFRTYVLQHLCIVIPISIGIYGNFLFFDTFADISTNLYIFIIFTYIHITVSFLNESWFRSFFKIV